MEKFLLPPSRQPDYRKNRPHERFVTNLDVTAALIKDALREAWAAHAPLAAAPDCGRLIAEKYSGDGIAIVEFGENQFVPSFLIQSAEVE